MQFRQECFGLSKADFPTTTELYIAGNTLGATNGGIMVFGAVHKYTGTSIQYISDANLGDSFLCMRTGIFSITLQVCPNGSSTTSAALSVNCTNLASVFTAGYNVGFRAYGTAAGTAQPVQLHWCGRLNPGDIVRAHAGAYSATQELSAIKICQVSI